MPSDSGISGIEMLRLERVGQHTSSQFIVARDLKGHHGAFGGGEREIVSVWVKAGNNASGDGPGYGERFDSDAECDGGGGTGGSGGAGMGGSDCHDGHCDDGCDDRDESCKDECDGHYEWCKDDCDGTYDGCKNDCDHDFEWCKPECDDDDGHCTP